MVVGLSQVCLGQMVLPEPVLALMVVLPAWPVEHQEWGGRVVLPQQAREPVPREQGVEDQVKEVCQKQVLQVQGEEDQALAVEPNPKALEAVEVCPLHRLQKMEVVAGPDYPLFHQRPVEVYQKQVLGFPVEGVRFLRMKVYHHRGVVGLVNPEQAVVLSRLVEEQARMNHHLQMKEEGEGLPCLFGMCFPLAREEEGERMMEGEARKIPLQIPLLQVHPQ